MTTPQPHTGVTSLPTSQTRHLEPVPPAPQQPEPLTELAAWLGKYIKTAHEDDLHTLTLWVVHTHLLQELATTPRLLLDSPVPGSGKTTVLDHFLRLCHQPVSAAALSSAALLARILAKEPRTILIDEAEKSLSPKKDGRDDMLAILNSGYRKGGSRPVLVPDKEQNWKMEEMSTHGAVAMAGNSPDLPEDTQQRSIRVLLLPDHAGTVLDSDWEEIEADAKELQARIALWADQQRPHIRNARPVMPDNLKGRNREKWKPLLKVAWLAGDKWPQICTHLIMNDLNDQAADREAGMNRLPRHVTLINDIRQAWPKGETFFATQDMLSAIKVSSPYMWTSQHEYGDLTIQGMGRMLVKHYNIRAERERGAERRRGYFLSQFKPAWDALGHTPSK
ncbi:DUF3631 domain-containing protein [Corynebacterium stationis]|uniref:DUF3631 domain-containing protein n=1 Tax=Corynebacterium stationis TaxID=1705 RepID=UPI00261681F9|nr:DUF3631 domain-containing protein [Corynebacterium stationis]